MKIHDEYLGNDSKPFVVNFLIDENKISIQFKGDYHFYPYSYQYTKPELVDKMINLAESHDGLNEFMSCNNIQKPHLQKNP